MTLNFTQNGVVIGHELGAYWDDAYQQGEVTRSWFEVIRRSHYG
jgi:hypothetical protein